VPAPLTLKGNLAMNPIARQASLLLIALGAATAQAAPVTGAAAHSPMRAHHAVPVAAVATVEIKRVRTSSPMRMSLAAPQPTLLADGSRARTSSAMRVHLVAPGA
jgi:hypothetical protein